MEVNRKHVVQLQGKDFITYDGLLDMAHQMGLISLETELVDKDPYIFRAVAKTDKQTFTGYGDADNENVNKMIAKHKIRMAETRAKARALRDLTNVGMCSVEEMGGDDAPAKTKKATYETAKETFDEMDVDDIVITDDDMPKPNPKLDVLNINCENCNAEMNQAQLTMSKHKFGGRALCPKCQKEVS